MKTLQEEISEVMAAKTTKTAKRIILKGMGLTDHDIYALFCIKAREDGENAPEFVRTPRTPRRQTVVSIIGKMTFGVEIECVGVMSRDGLCEAARQHGLQMRFEGYNHNDHKRQFKLVTDASLSGAGAIECVSPVLKGSASGFDKLKACCDALAEVGASVNRSTGLHVHVGYENMTDEHYINVFKNYKMLEGLIDSFMANSRRGDSCQWAHTFARYNFNNCTTIADVHNVLNGNRYHKVNPCSWSRHHTIEFRQHQGSTDYEKISMWAKFCLKLVAWSKDNVLTEAVTDIRKVAFLTAAEKSFFKARIERFAAAA